MVADHLVLVGERPELDLDRLAASSADAAQIARIIGNWWNACRELWEAATRDRVAGMAWLRTRRVLIDAAQSTAKKDKRDLSEEFLALTDAGPLARLVIEATAADPDRALVQSMAKAIGGTAEFDVVPNTATGTSATTAATLTLPMAGTMWWPSALGGIAWPGEVGREAVVGLRYAAWRDRRVRRLATVRVTSTELWADPARTSL